MAEVKLPPVTLNAGESFYGDEDAVIFTRLHSHADILRYVVADQGLEITRVMLEGMHDE
jgi:hypothetical protein